MEKTTDCVGEVVDTRSLLSGAKWNRPKTAVPREVCETAATGVWAEMPAEAQQNARNLTKQGEALLSERVDLYMKMQY